MSSNMSLDDSLTSIQWLCQLDSNKLMDEDVTGACHSEKQSQAAITSIDHQENTEKNPHPKPHYSYATLIVFAINSSIEKRMTLQEIYAWIQDNYPYYKYAKKGWKNSIRHNLSLHKFFVKEKRPTVLHGKGSFWRISPEGKENLVRDLMKHPHHNLQPPCALLPHDPNRKLRPIMPKPNDEGNEPRIRYVPLLTCNLPVVFVPSPAMQSGIMDGVPLVGTCKEQAKIVPAPAEVKAVVHSTTSNASTINDAKPRIEVVATSTDPLQTMKVPQTSPFKQASTVNNSEPQMNYGGEFSETKPKLRQNSKNQKQLPNILRRKRKSKARSPESTTKPHAPRRINTPRRLQPTLAAINSNHSTSSPKRSLEELVSSVTELTSSPVTHNTSFDFFNAFGCSPGFSPLRSPAPFGASLHTPVRHDTDSGIMMTPLKGSLGDLSFNWTPFKTGFTPVMASPPGRPISKCGETSQGCRKSLGLE